MLRSELVEIIAKENEELRLTDAERVVDVIFDEIVDAMARGDRVELRGFGVFSARKRDARAGRNPRTGASVDVEAKTIPFFKAGKQIRGRLNEGS